MLCLRRYVGSIRALESRRYASPTGVARRPVAALYGWGHADVHRLTDTAAPWPLDAKRGLRQGRCATPSRPSYRSTAFALLSALVAELGASSAERRATLSQA